MDGSDDGMGSLSNFGHWMSSVAHNNLTGVLILRGVVFGYPYMKEVELCIPRWKFWHRIGDFICISLNLPRSED